MSPEDLVITKKLLINLMNIVKLNTCTFKELCMDGEHKAL